MYMLADHGWLVQWEVRVRMSPEVPYSEGVHTVRAMWMAYGNPEAA